MTDKRSLGVTLCALTAVGALTAAAAHAEVHACVNQNNGQVRIADEDSDCSEFGQAFAPLVLDDDWTGAGTGGMATLHGDDRVRIGPPSGQDDARLTVNAQEENAIRVRVDGTTHFAVTRNGRTGVGTTSPAARLQVNARPQENALAIRFASVEPEVVIDAEGNLGVGDPAPTDKLSVLETGTGRAAFLRIDNSSNVAAALSAITNGRGSAVFANISSSTSDAPVLFAFHSGQGPVARFNRGDVEVLEGRVGIGTTDPDAALHVSGGTGSVELLIEADTDNSGESHQPRLTLSQDGGAVTGRLGYFNATNDLTLVNVFGGARMVLRANGGVCIGSGC